MVNKNTLIIGHRGVGKTSFLRRLHARYPEVRCVDLDEEMARAEGTSIEGLWTRGEAAFRQLERATLESLVGASAGPLCVALGAGFKGPPPAGSHVFSGFRRRGFPGPGSGPTPESSPP